MKTLEFLNKHELENNLAEQIVKDLNDSIQSNGRATLLVSGGSTPKELYRKLSLYDIAWDKVDIGLVDERFVPTSEDSSNEKMIKEKLLINYAEKASLTGMIHFSNDLFKNIEEVKKNYYKFSKGATTTILGMGNDGHTASLFPGNNSSEDSFKGVSVEKVINTLSPSEPRRRVSCSAELLFSSSNLYLMMVGEDKLAVFNQAHLLKLPISYFIPKLTTYYAPKN